MHGDTWESHGVQKLELTRQLLNCHKIPIYLIADVDYIFFDKLVITIQIMPRVFPLD